jgi:hypothetical protein
MNEKAIACVGLQRQKKKLCSTAYKKKIIYTFCSGISLLLVIQSAADLPAVNECLDH